MDFYSKEDFRLMQEYAGKVKSPDLQSVYDSLQEMYAKTKYWADSVCKASFPEGIVKIIQKPTNQGGYFEHYQWAKIYPNEECLNNKKLAFTVGIEKEGLLVIKIDTVGLLEKDPLRKKYLTYRDQNHIRFDYKSDEIDNWRKLIDISVQDIKKLMPNFQKLQAILMTTTNKIANNSTSKVIQNKNMHSLNTILYGPPGTGKTYHTINKAIAIANPSFDLSQGRTKIKEEYDRLIKDGQIVFTTFHQSMAYEDFIEGIKPEVSSSDLSPIQYKVKDGIFKLICDKAKKQNEIILQIEDKDTIFSKEIFQDLYFSFVETLPIVTSENSDIILKTKTGVPFYLFKNSAGSIAIKAGEMKAPMSAALNELSAVYFDGKEPTYPPYEKLIIEKLLESRTITSKPIENDKKNFVLIIDEINRGNVSAIFGELITLIEETKRAGKEEALEVTLPYGKEEKFSVPSNVYIIGTMNTADRSVEALDTALRRRFSFEEMMPDYSLEELQYDLFGYDAYEILQAINERIFVLLDREHQIGHSYFIGKDENTILDSFYKNIIPLLQEYFFGDYGKIGLVLGNGFVRMAKKKSQDKLFAKFDQYSGINQYDDLERFEIIPKNEVDINTAIQSLMN